MDFEIKQKSKMKVKIYDKEFAVRKPGIGEIEQMETAVRSTPNQSLKIMTGYLVGLGFDEPSIRNLEMEHFMELCEFMNGTKKK